MNSYLNRPKTTKSDEIIIFRHGFKLGKTIGRGSYGKVFLAYAKNETEIDKQTGKPKLVTYACKYINGEEAQLEFYSKFFPREIEVMEKVKHISCIRIHKIFQRRLRYYVFMTYCENGDLLDFIRESGIKMYIKISRVRQIGRLFFNIPGSVTEDQAHFWFCQVLRGLQYLTNLGVCHRDLKPDNLLLTAGYNIKISDFGFAKRLMADEPSRTFCGSIAYTPPEIIHGDPYDPTYSDIWSAGVVLYVMLNKSIPFDDSNLKLLHEAQISKRWKLRSHIAEVVSSNLTPFLSLMLEPDPKIRQAPWELWKHPWVQNGPTSVEPELDHDKIDVDWEARRQIEVLNSNESKRNTLTKAELVELQNLESHIPESELNDKDEEKPGPSSKHNNKSKSNFLDTTKSILRFVDPDTEEVNGPTKDIQKTKSVLNRTKSKASRTNLQKTKSKTQVQLKNATSTTNALKKIKSGIKIEKKPEVVGISNEVETSDNMDGEPTGTENQTQPGTTQLNRTQSNVKNAKALTSTTMLSPEQKNKDPKK